MKDFITGHGFVLDGIIYELLEKCEKCIIAAYSDGDNIICACIQNKDMQRAEPLQF